MKPNGRWGAYIEFVCKHMVPNPGSTKCVAADPPLKAVLLAERTNVIRCQTCQCSTQWVPCSRLLVWRQTTAAYDCMKIMQSYSLCNGRYHCEVGVSAAYAAIWSAYCPEYATLQVAAVAWHVRWQSCSWCSYQVWVAVWFPAIGMWVNQGK